MTFPVRTELTVEVGNMKPEGGKRGDPPVKLHDPVGLPCILGMPAALEKLWHVLGHRLKRSTR